MFTNNYLSLTIPTTSQIPLLIISYYLPNIYNFDQLIPFAIDVSLATPGKQTEASQNMKDDENTYASTVAIMKTCSQTAFTQTTPEVFTFHYRHPQSNSMYGK